MDKIVILFIVISLISIVKSIQEKKKKQKKKNAFSSVQAAKSVPVKPEGKKASTKADRISVSASENKDPFQREILTSFTAENAPLSVSDIAANSLFTDIEGSASEEGEDPCHSDMLTGPAESEPEAFFSGTADSQELLRAFVLGEVLSKPKALRRKA